MLIFTLLLLPLLSNAKIKLNITTAATLKEASVTYTGEDKKLVTDLETEVFNLTIDNVKYGIRVELGRYPENVFMKDPTKYDNLYEKFHWQPVTRRVRVEKAEIVDIIDEPVVLKVHEFINNTTEKIRTTVDIYDDVENTAYSTWSKYGFPIDDLEYEVNIYFKSVRKSLAYTNTWRNGTYRNNYIKFGATKPGYVVVKPGDSLKTTLKAFKSIMLVEISYVTDMIGRFIADFEELEGIHYHFFAPSVLNIMKAGGIYKVVKTKELMEIRFFTDPQLSLSRKRDNGTVLIVAPPSPFKVRKNKKLDNVPNN